MSINNIIHIINVKVKKYVVQTFFYSKKDYVKNGYWK